MTESIHHLFNENSCVTYIKVRVFLKRKFRDFAIFGKFAKDWNRKIFDLIELAKVNSRENVQFFGPKSLFPPKIYFFSKSF